MHPLWQVYPDHRLDLAFFESFRTPAPSQPLQYEHNPKTPDLSGLGLDSLTTLGDALKEGLAVLVELQRGDDDLGGVQGQVNALAVALLAVDTLDVNDILQAVYTSDLALTALVGTALDDDLVVLADGDGADLSRVRVSFACPSISP